MTSGPPPGPAPARRRRGLLLAKVVGVPVVVAPSWFAFAVLVVASSGSALVPDRGAAVGYAAGGAFALLLLASVVLHELGHCLVARLLGLPVRGITITLLAGITEMPDPPATPAEEYSVAAAGPMVSLLLASVAFGVAPAFSDGSLASLALLTTGVTNLLLLAFNVLPGLPLDGGRVLRAGLWGVLHDESRATRAAARAGQGIGLLVLPGLLIGVLPAVGLGRLDEQTVLFTALVGVFLFVAASASLRQVDRRDRLPSVSVAELARPALAVTASTPLAEAQRRAGEAGLRALVVVDAAGAVQGVVSESWVSQVPAERRPWVSVGDGALTVRGRSLDPSLVGQALLDAMIATPAAAYVVPGETLRVLVSADVASVLQGRTGARRTRRRWALASSR